MILEYCNYFLNYCCSGCSDYSYMVAVVILLRNKWSRICVQYQSTRVHSRFLVWLVFCFVPCSSNHCAGCPSIYRFWFWLTLLYFQPLIVLGCSRQQMLLIVLYYGLYSFYTSHFNSLLVRYMFTRNKGPPWSWSYDSWITKTPVKWVHITTNVMNLNPAHGDVYQIQHSMIKFSSDLPLVEGFHRVLPFPPPLQLTAMI